ncbi:MAG: DHHA1 domain-containing protein, partial [Bacteroidota bacterium]
ERSRAAGKIETDDWVELIEDEQSEFIGYDRIEAPVRITKYRKIKTKGKDLFQLVLNVTPFYPEGGGQVGDKGWLIAGDSKVKIIDTKKENNLPVHFTTELPEDLNALFTAKVDASQRQSSARNHTATHLLHEALREVLGDHVEQKGSLVNGDYLRFDFSHFSKTNQEEIEKIEDLVNQRIIANLPLEEFRAIPIDEAKEKGAMMLFGEKYGDLVRMIQFGSSKELCGGTHVQASGEIGLFRIQSEGAVAAGIRRIEAVSGAAALAEARKERNTLEELHQVLKQQDLLKAVQDLHTKAQDLTKKVEQFEKDKGKQVKQELKSKIQDLNGVPFLAEEVDLNGGQIRDIAFQLKGEMESLFAVFGSQAGGKVTITCLVTEDLVKEKGLHAGNIVRELAKEIKGGGGGQPFFATAGGKDPNGLPSAIKKASSYLS